MKLNAHTLWVRLLQLLNGLYVLIFLLSMASFLLGPQWGQSTYDYTQTLTEPQPICKGRVQAENGRVYVFSEELCAVNAYTEEGDFLFCVRGNRFQNGGADFFVMEDIGIFIESRDYILYRFDETGTYRGRAEDGNLYNADGTLRGPYRGTIVFFDDDWYCYYKWDNLRVNKTFYVRGYGTEERIGTEAELAANHEAEEEADGPRYFTFLNSLYVSRDGKISRLASTPFYRTFFHSPFLAFGTCLVSLFVMPHLTARLAERLEIGFSVLSAVRKKRKANI